MLKEFRVSNFKSINDEQIFTMEACSKNEVSEFPEHVVNIGDERLLKVSSFYGPNGGGKTNLLSALFVLSNIVKGFQIENDARGNANYMPCLFNESDNKYTSFTIFFIKDDMEVGYSLLVDLSKNRLMPSNIGLMINILDINIIKEELSFRKLGTSEFNTVFERNEQGVVISQYLSDVDLVKSARPLQKSTSFINYIINTFGINNQDEHFKPIITMGVELFSIFWLNKETNKFHFTKETVDILSPILEKAAELLNGLDFRIKGLRFLEVNQGTYGLYIDREKENGEIYSIQSNCESSGTRKVLNIILDILNYKDSAVFIADDFDSHLHPKLIRTIIELFTSVSNTNKQLIFNSHDITNMNNKVFRRDEIWFAFRKENALSTSYLPLSSIVDYKGNMVRKDAVYGKQYLEGRYGADPFIKKGLGWTNG